MPRAPQALSSTIRDVATTSLDSFEFRGRALAAMHACVPFDAACLAVTDPVALVPIALTTSGYDAGIYPTVLDIEYGPGYEPGRFETMRRRRVPIRTLREATGGRVRRSRFYADVLAPHGLRDEVRMLFRGSDGVVWGACTLARAGQSSFTDAEVARLGHTLTDVGDGLRTTLFRTSTPGPAEAEVGPAVAIVSPHNEVELLTGAARAWFGRLGWGDDGRRASSVPAVTAAAWLRRSGQGSVALRARTRDGEWVVLRAGWSTAPRGSVVVSLERAHLPDVATLAATSFALTGREAEVLTHLLAGESREQMAKALCISPWTVQDHLRSIYAKTGTSGRRGLVALLVHTEYVPRLGTPVGPNRSPAAPGRNTESPT